MADTVPITAGSGTVVGTDEVTIGGTLQHVQRMKLVDGTDGGTSLIGGFLETGASALGALAVGGGTPHDSVDSGNPVKIGGKANDAAPTQVSANADRVDAWLDRRGAMFTRLTDSNGAAIATGVQYVEDVALTANAGQGTLIIGRRTDTLATLTPVVDDAVGLRTSSRGALWVQSDVKTDIVGTNRYDGVSMVQDIEVSSTNSSTTNIASAASFTGTSATILGVAAIQVVLFANENCTIQVQQSQEDPGTNWNVVDSWTYAASSTGQDAARTVQAMASSFRVIVTNNGASTTTTFRLQSLVAPMADTLPRGLTQLGNLRVAFSEPALAASADALANPTISQIGAEAMWFNGTTWDRARTTPALSAAPNVDTGVLAAGIGPGFDRKTDPAGVAATSTANAVTVIVNGANMIAFHVTTIGVTPGSMIIETTSDDTNWATAGMVYKLSSGPDLRVEGSFVPAVNDIYTVRVTGVRQVRYRVNATYASGTATVKVTASAAAAMVKGTDLAPAPHNIGYALVSVAAQYTSAQTSTTIGPTVSASQRMVVTYVQIQAGGTVAGTQVTVYFGTGAYTRGTSKTVFDGEFAPSATLKPGAIIAPPVPFVGAADEELKITNVGAINPLTITIAYYLIAA